MIVGGLLGEEEAAKKRCLKKLKDKKAFTPETAINLDEVGIKWHEENALKELHEMGTVKKTEDDRYYIVCRERQS